MNNKKVMFEVCVDSAQGLHAAIAGGADRIELCAALALGGLTPSAGLLYSSARMFKQSHVMIRPRPGDFVYTPDDIDVMLADIDAVKTAGLEGVVLGALRSDNSLDTDALQTLSASAGDLDKTLHRAFDLTADVSEALEIAVDLGFTRILTSGQASNVPDGLTLLSSLVHQAAGRIQIMAGGGVTLEAIPALMDIGVDAIHASCSTQILAQRDCSLIGIGIRSDTEQRRVMQFKNAIQGLGKIQSDGARKE